MIVNLLRESQSVNMKIPNKFKLLLVITIHNRIPFPAILTELSIFSIGN